MLTNEKRGGKNEAKGKNLKVQPMTNGFMFISIKVNLINIFKLVSMFRRFIDQCLC